MRKERLYVVMNRMVSGEWSLADFWDMPFVSTDFYVAHKMKREIEARQTANHWKYKKSRVVKIEVRP